MGATPKLVSRLDPRIRLEWLKQTKGDVRVTDAIVGFLESRTFLSPELEGDNHHMLWRAEYPRYKKCRWNIIRLTREDHISVHALMVAALPMDLSLRRALKATMMKRSCLWRPINLEQLKKLYLLKNWTLAKLGRKYSIEPATIARFLRQNGISVRNRAEAHPCWRPKNPEKVKKLYHEGWSAVDIGKRYATTSGTIKSFLQRNRIHVRGVGEARRCKQWKPKNPDRVKKLYQNGWCCAAIGKKYGVTREAISTFLKQNKVSIRNNGESHRWNPGNPEQVKKRYYGRWSTKRIGKAYAVSMTAVVNFLRREGVSRRANGELLKWKPKNPEQVKSLYRTGMSTTHLGRKYRISVSAIKLFLRANDIAIRRCIWHRPSIEVVKRLYFRGWTLQRLATKYSSSRSGISSFLKRNGIRTRGCKEAANFRKGQRRMQ